MATVLLSLLVVAPLLALGVALAHRARSGMLHEHTLAVAAVAGRDPGDVVTYTQDCSLAACMLLARRGHGSPVLLDTVLRGAITQVDSVQRAARLLGALGQPCVDRRRAAAWPDFLLWMAGVFDAGVVANIITWRGESGISDLREMTERAIERFRATVDGSDQSPLMTLFAEEMVRLGLLDEDELDEGGDDERHGEADPA